MYCLTDSGDWWLIQGAAFAGVLGRGHRVREEGGEEQVVVSSRSLTSATCILHLAMCVHSGSGFGQLPSHVNCCCSVVDHSRSLRRVLGLKLNVSQPRWEACSSPSGIQSNYTYILLHKAFVTEGSQLTGGFLAKHLQKMGRKQLLRTTSRVRALMPMMDDQRGRTSPSDLSYRGRVRVRVGRTSYCRSSSLKPALSRAAS